MRFWLIAIPVLIWLGFGFLLGMVIGVLSGLILGINRNLNHWMSRIICPPVLWFTGIRLRVEGAEILEGETPRVFVANHQSMMDVMTLASLCPRKTVFIAKHEVLYLPLVNLYFFCGGNIAIRRTNKAHALTGLSKAAQAIRDKGASVWMFPEGTRNKTPEPLGPFKKGSFHLAIEAQVPLVPIVSGALAPRFDWKRRRFSPGVLGIRVLNPISTRGLTKADVDTLLEKTRAQMLQACVELTASVR